MYHVSGQGVDERMINVHYYYYYYYYYNYYIEISLLFNILMCLDLESGCKNVR